MRVRLTCQNLKSKAHSIPWGCPDQVTASVYLLRKNQMATIFWLLLLGIRQIPALWLTSFKTSIVGNGLTTGFLGGSECESPSDATVGYTCRWVAINFALGQRIASQSEQDPHESGAVPTWLPCPCQTQPIHLSAYTALVWKVFSSPLSHFLLTINNRWAGWPRVNANGLQVCKQ